MKWKPPSGKGITVAICCVFLLKSGGLRGAAHSVVLFVLTGLTRKLTAAAGLSPAAPAPPDATQAWRRRASRPRTRRFALIRNAARDPGFEWLSLVADGSMPRPFVALPWRPASAARKCCAFAARPEAAGPAWVWQTDSLAVRRTRLLSADWLLRRAPPPGCWRRRQSVPWRRF